jgi:hypothetical protein
MAPAPKRPPLCVSPMMLVLSARRKLDCVFMVEGGGGCRWYVLLTRSPRGGGGGRHEL